MKQILTATLLILATKSYGAGYGILENKLLQLQVSNLGPTRITLDTEKITDVFFYPEEAAKVILHQSGYVFVVPREDSEHVYLTVMGESGSTQDLRLRFVKKQPEPIRLFCIKQPQRLTKK